MTVLEATARAREPRRSRFVLAHNVVLLSGSQVVTWSASLAWSLVVPRIIGPEQMGVYTLGVAAGGVLTVVIGLGMQPLLVREIASDPTRAPELIGTSIVLRSLLSMPVLAAVVMVATMGRFGSAQAMALSLGWGMCIFYLIAEPIQSAFQAAERMKYIAYAGILTKTGVAVFSIALVFVGIRAVGLLLTSITVQAAIMLINFFWVRTLTRIDWRVTWTRLRSLFVASLPYWGFAAFFTIYLWVDSLMLGVMTSSTVLGWYALPTKLFGTLMFVPTILSTAWLPQMVKNVPEGGDRIWRTARTSIELVLILSMPIAVGTGLVAPGLFHLLYGPAYDPAVPVMIVLAGCVPLMYFGTMVNQVLIARKRQMDWTKVMAFASVFNPICNALLIPYFQQHDGNGAIGAAVSLLLTELVISGIGIAFTRRAFSTATVLRLVRALLATAGMGVLVEMSLRSGGPAAGIATGVLVFPALLWALRVLTVEERDQLRDMLRTSVRSIRPEFDSRGHTRS